MEDSHCNFIGNEGFNVEQKFKTIHIVIDSRDNKIVDLSILSMDFLLITLIVFMTSTGETRTRKILPKREPEEDQQKQPRLRAESIQTDASRDVVGQRRRSVGVVADRQSQSSRK